MAVQDWLDIDGQRFNVSVMSIKENGTILYSDNTGRTMAVGAPMTLDPLGTFFNYTITIKRNGDDLDDYDRLYDYVMKPRYGGMTITAPHNQGVQTFEAYISAAEREVSHIDDKGQKVYWKEMSLTITAMKAQVTP